MSSVAVVTTFAKDHINIYGKKFVESFKAYCNYPLYIYAEDFTENDIGHKVVDFYTAIPEHKEFKENIEQLKSNASTKESNRLRKALRWSYKSFSTIHALENIKTDYIVWIDADVRTLSTIPANLIEHICEKNLLMCYPQVLSEGIHIESGFVIFNKRHSNISQVIDHYKNGYYKNQILTIPKPWDGYWLSSLVYSNLQSECKLVLTPFSNIRQYFKHDVGKNKFRATRLNKYSGRSENT